MSPCTSHSQLRRYLQGSGDCDTNFCFQSWVAVLCISIFFCFNSPFTCNFTLLYCYIISGKFIVLLPTKKFSIIDYFRAHVYNISLNCSPTDLLIFIILEIFSWWIRIQRIHLWRYIWKANSSEEHFIPLQWGAGESHRERTAGVGCWRDRERKSSLI